MTKVCHTFLLIVAVNNGTLSIEALIKLSACYLGTNQMVEALENELMDPITLL